VSLRWHSLSQYKGFLDGYPRKKVTSFWFKRDKKNKEDAGFQLGLAPTDGGGFVLFSVKN
jgi:hypothetical protein